MYALKIRKIDLDLLTQLNKGVTPTVEKKDTYLIVRPSGENEIVSALEFQTKYADKVAVNSPKLFKINSLSKSSK